MFVPNRFPPFREPWLVPLLLYCVICCFIFLGDGLMSYVTPLFIQSVVGNPLVMGLVMSFSSVVGIACDTLFPQMFHSRRHLFFLWCTVLISLFFPLSFLLLPKAIMTFLLAVAIWGVYFEFLIFSNSAFIRANIMLENNALAWGLILTARSIAQFLSPIIATPLYDISPKIPMIVALFFFFAAMATVAVLATLFPSRVHGSQQKVVTKEYSFWQQLKVWKLLFGRLWPIYLLLFGHFMIEASFWTIGVILAEKLQEQVAFGQFFVSFYLAPFLYMGLLAKPLSRRFGKKRTAFVSSAVAGICLLWAGMQGKAPMFLIGVVVAAHFLALALPELLATYQDYSLRAGKHSQDIVGIQASASSLGWILGPILAGGLASFMGYEQTFSVLGAGIGIVAVLAFLVVPRKIHLPQTAINQVTP